VLGIFATSKKRIFFIADVTLCESHALTSGKIIKQEPVEPDDNPREDIGHRKV
jgi:hypothetical protein